MLLVRVCFRDELAAVMSALDLKVIAQIECILDESFFILTSRIDRWPFCLVLGLLTTT